MISRPFFTRRKTHMHMNLDHIASGHFVLGRDVLCEFDYWPLAVSMPPTKVSPQCKAAVPSCNTDSLMPSLFFAHCDLILVSRSKWKAEYNLRAVESDSVKSARKAKDKLHKACKKRPKLVSELCMDRNKTECARQAWESHKTVINF